MTAPSLWSPNGSGIAAAAAALRRGRVIAFPTDTVLGLAACARDPAAVRAISEVKGRSPMQPLVLMAATIAEIAEFAAVDGRAAGLAARFWPGPLTLILPSRPAGRILGGVDTVGARIPAHPLALELLAAAGPLATTSANRHGRPPVADAAAAIAELPGLAGAVAAPAGPAAASEPSSILDLTRRAPTLLRRGRLGPEELDLPGLEDLSGTRRD